MSTQEERRAMLESMQIKGIRWMIWQHIGEENAKERLLSITNQSTIADIRKFVDSQNRETLIKLIDVSPEISPELIESAYDKYRYGLRPGFTLFWVGVGILISLMFPSEIWVVIAATVLMFIGYHLFCSS